MSFSTTSIPGSSVIRLAITAAGLALAFSGCATDSDRLPPGDEQSSNVQLEAPSVDPLAADRDSSPPVERGDAAEASIAGEEDDEQAAQPEILTYWETIRGGIGSPDTTMGNAMTFLTGGDHIQFIRPVALTVRGEYLYVVDMGLELVLRYNLVTGRIEKLVELRGITGGDVADIYVTKDYTFYLTDTFGSRVLHFDRRGRLQRTISSKLNMVRPVAVVEDEPTGNILVADGEFDQVLVFNQLGDLFTAIGGRGSEPGRFLNITAMAVGPDGFYIAARVGEHVQVLTRDGDYLYSLEQGGVVFPLAMAASDDFRVFVSDYLDDTIKVFERGRHVASIGGTGVTPGRFKRITDLWLEDSFLYIADSLNGRIQVMRVVAGAPVTNVNREQ